MGVDLQYQQLVSRILRSGELRDDKSRPGVRRSCVFGHQINMDVSTYFPLLQLKDTPLRPILVELFWFLRGDVNIQYLVKNKCNIWNKDAYQHYLNNSPEPVKMGFTEFVDFVANMKEPMELTYKYRMGDLGPIYGKQWRSYGPSIYSSLGQLNETDQIARVLQLLVKDPDSTGMVVTAWNPSMLPYVALSACHHGFQFDSVLREDGRHINLLWNQRSVDVALGLPFNIASYALLLHIVCLIVQAKPGKLIGQLGNCHLYEDHIEPMRELAEAPVPDNKTILCINNNDELFGKYMMGQRKLLNEVQVYSKSMLDSLFNQLDPMNFSVENYSPNHRIKLKMHEKIIH